LFLASIRSACTWVLMALYFPSTLIYGCAVLLRSFEKKKSFFWNTMEGESEKTF
jgi:hypothetical protein